VLSVRPLISIDTVREAADAGTATVSVLLPYAEEVPYSTTTVVAAPPVATVAITVALVPATVLTRSPLTAGLPPPGEGGTKGWVVVVGVVVVVVVVLVVVDPPPPPPPPDEAVVKVPSGPAVVPPAFVATNRKWYVVPEARPETVAVIARADEPVPAETGEVCWP
jgi:hypothetical protein